jgi:hypothetical protein
MLGSMLYAASQDSATMDEPVHAVAAYTYVKTLDYRLNPEHPPLVKDLVGLAISTLPVHYPFSFFYRHISLEYDQGYKFLFGSGNDADAILFRGRLVIIAITILMGVFVFVWSKHLSGAFAGLFSLILFAFDPNIRAHGHFITQDAAISAAILINLYFVWKFLLKPSPMRLVIAGITCGIAFVTKFSAPLLIPIYIVLAIYSAKRGYMERPGVPMSVGAAAVDDVPGIGGAAGRAFVRSRLRYYTLSFVSILLIAFIVFYGVYSINMLHFSTYTQRSVIELKTGGNSPLSAHWLNDSVLRPIPYYLLGISMVQRHVTGGHDVFILGQLRPTYRWYYPIAFTLKSTIPTLLLILGLIVFGRRIKTKSPTGEATLVSGFVIFALAALIGNLNLGSRYLLPIYPLFYVYAGKIALLFRTDITHNSAVAPGIGNTSTSSVKRSLANLGAWATKPGINNLSIKAVLLNTVIVGLALWQIVTCMRISPYYVSYFNELVGPIKGGTLITDANVDWGQDLRRLKTYVDRNNIEHFTLDYFGGCVPSYYFGDKVTLWKPQQKGRPRGWFAVSVTDYSVGIARHKYQWLEHYKPVAYIGYSIKVYKLP